MREVMSMPFQNALKFPATIPDRIVNDAPPSRDAVTISCTCLEWELVKILVNSGMTTAARVPQLMIRASCHQSSGSNFVTCCPLSINTTEMSPMSIRLMKKDVEMQRIAAIQMRRVNGASKLISFSPLYFVSEIAWLMKYDTPDMKSIRKRMAKIHTMSFDCMSRKFSTPAFLVTARVMNEMSATPVTP